MNAIRKAKTAMIGAAAAALVAVFGFACSSPALNSVLATDSGSKEPSKPINNPFGEYHAGADHDGSSGFVLRAKKGDRAVEVELPRTNEGVSDFVLPVSSAYKDGGRSPASDPMETYRQRKPSIADREITGGFANSHSPDEEKRHEVEQGLGLMPADDLAPEADSSYLAALDRIKQLYRAGRYEAGLLESDEIVKNYPTDPKIYEMRGTLFDRMGRGDLAVKSWIQALRLNPANQVLKKFVERRQQRNIASQPGGPQPVEQQGDTP